MISDWKKGNDPAGVFALFCLGMIFFTILFSCFLLLLDHPTTISVLPVGILAAFLFSLMFSPGVKTLFGGILSCAVMFPLFYAAAGLYPDFSFDGLWYHQAITEALWQGKNVFNETTGVFWGDVFPKGMEIFCGETLKLLPNTNVWVICDLILASGVFACSLRFGKKMGIATWKTIFCAVLLTFHPVFLQQIYTGYVDTPLYFCSFLILASTILLLEEPTLLDVCILTFASAIAIATKMTGGQYPFVAFCILAFVSIYRTKSIISPMKTYLAPGLVVAVVGVGIMGFNPYITNLAQGKHIFYPLRGSGEKIEVSCTEVMDAAKMARIAQQDGVIDIESCSGPANFIGRDRLYMFVHSLTGRTENTSDPGVTRSKLIPGLVYPDEIISAGNYGIRIAGWGPLFWTVFLASLLLPVFFTMNRRLLIPAMAFIVLNTLLHPESWWARFAPQVYLFPVFLFFSQDSARRGMKFPANVCQGIFLVALLCNLYLVAYSKVLFMQGQDSFYASFFEEAKKNGIIVCTEVKNVSSPFNTRLLLRFYDMDISRINKEQCFSGETLQTRTIYDDIWFFDFVYVK